MTRGNPDQPSAAVPVLGYARTVTHHGVTIERGRGTARVTMPSSHFKYALIWWVAGSVYLGSQFVARLWLGTMRGRDHVAIVIVATIMTVALALVILSRHWRGIIEVTPEWVRVGQMRFGDIGWRMSWRRAAVGEIKYNPYSEQLLFRITDQDTLDVPVPGDEPTKLEIAQALGEALIESPEPPGGE